MNDRKCDHKGHYYQGENYEFFRCNAYGEDALVEIGNPLQAIADSWSADPAIREALREWSPGLAGLLDGLK